MDFDMKLKVIGMGIIMAICSILTAININIWYGIFGVAISILYTIISLKQINKEISSGDYFEVHAKCIGASLADDDIRNKIMLKKKDKYYDYIFRKLDDSMATETFVVRQQAKAAEYKINLEYVLYFKKTPAGDFAGENFISSKKYCAQTKDSEDDLKAPNTKQTVFEYIRAQKMLKNNIPKHDNTIVFKPKQ